MCVLVPQHRGMLRDGVGECGWRSTLIQANCRWEGRCAMWDLWRGSWEVGYEGMGVEWVTGKWVSFEM